MEAFKFTSHFLSQLTTDWRSFSRAAARLTVNANGFSTETGVNGGAISINAYLGNDGMKIIDKDQKQRRAQDRAFGDIRVRANGSGNEPVQND